MHSKSFSKRSRSLKNMADEVSQDNNRALREMVNTLDLNPHQKQLIFRQLNKAFETGKAPLWSELFSSKAIHADLDLLISKHGSLLQAEKTLCGSLPHDVSCTLNLGYTNISGQDLQPQLEMQLVNLLRRLHHTEAMARKQMQEKPRHTTHSLERLNQRWPNTIVHNPSTATSDTKPSTTATTQLMGGRGGETKGVLETPISLTRDIEQAVHRAEKP